MLPPTYRSKLTQTHWRKRM